MKQSFLIGLLVIISQTIVTTIVLLGFYFLSLGLSFSKGLILGALLYDCVAIVSHVMYRKIERERMEVTANRVVISKLLLIVHGSTSVVALVISFFLLQTSLSQASWLFVTSLWIISLTSGAIIFYRKYSTTLKAV